MTHPLLDMSVGDLRLRVVATDRVDGDVHPERVPARELQIRQRNITGHAWSMTDQVHGVDAIEATGGEPWQPMLGVADVLVTQALNAPLAVWAADCAPIVLAADDGTLVGAHGGWRGLAAGVVDVAVLAAQRSGGAVVAAALGPVIHPCCYEFGVEDLDTIPDAVAAVTSQGTAAVDIPATVAASLARSGIVLDSVGPCTGCDERWFSHRARADVGRHAVVAWWAAA